MLLLGWFVTAPSAGSTRGELQVLEVALDLLLAEGEGHRLLCPPGRRCDGHGIFALATRPDLDLEFKIVCIVHRLEVVSFVTRAAQTLCPSGCNHVVGCSDILYLKVTRNAITHSRPYRASTSGSGTHETGFLMDYAAVLDDHTRPGGLPSRSLRQVMRFC